jgi:two-component sensor histidine kinase
MSQSGPIDARLRALHDISMELSRAEDSDSLCRRAVELCISRLGFDRLGIWFLDPGDPRMMRGTWGTDEEGKPRDERGIIIRRDEKYHPPQIYDGTVPFAVLPAEEVYDDRGGAVGRSDKAIAPLWDGARIVGEMVADNLFSHRPIDEEDGEVLVLFARIVAHLSALKRGDRALREALSAKALLLDELRHRTMNSFALMGSLISIEANRVGDSSIEAAFRKLRSRVTVMSSLYRQLDASGGLEDARLDEYLQKVAVDLMEGYGAETRGVALRCRLEEVVVDAKLAIVLGLILNELVTDSLKHAFPKGRRGEISLALRRGEGVCELSVADDGVGLSADPEPGPAKGAGLALVDLLCAQIGAGIERREGAGLAYAILFDIRPPRKP